MCVRNLDSSEIRWKIPGYIWKKDVKNYFLGLWKNMISGDYEVYELYKKPDLVKSIKINMLA